jgi:hypothetical protein
VEVHAPAPLVYEVISSAGKTLESQGNENIVEFDVEAAGRKIKTVEKVILEPPVIKYRWLKGPLPFVEEEIQVTPQGANSEVTYEGRYATGPGLVNWALGIFVVKRAFDRAVTEHLAQAKRVAEKRAKRSKVYGAGTRPEKT